MPRYEELKPAVQAVVDRKAEELARRDGITVEQARKDIAATVYIWEGRTDHGAGH